MAFRIDGVTPRFWPLHQIVTPSTLKPRYPLSTNTAVGFCALRMLTMLDGFWQRMAVVGRLRMPTTRHSLCVVPALTLTPNSYGWVSLVFGNALSIADVTQGAALASGIRTAAVTADKGYDSD